jgi:hypothetical protein
MDGDRDSGPLSGATIDISAEGGFAVQAVTHHVDHDTRAFAFSQRQLCGATCGAPSDSAAGTLAASTADSVFNVVLEQARSLRKDDYGITRHGADMMTYTIRLASSGRVRTIRGDDGSLPEAARTLVTTVYTAISTARAR